VFGQEQDPRLVMRMEIVLIAQSLQHVAREAFLEKTDTREITGKGTRLLYLERERERERDSISSAVLSRVVSVLETLKHSVTPDLSGLFGDLNIHCCK
jgi:hypothetical protein